jgi:hypothetical protein
MNLAVTAYQGYFKPIPFKRYNWLEACNEVHIAAATLNVMMFTEWVPDPEVRYLYGWTFIAIMASTLFWNLIFVIHGLINLAKLLIIKLNNRIKHWCRKKDLLYQESESEESSEEEALTEQNRVIEPTSRAPLNIEIEEDDDPWAKIDRVL